MRVGIIGAGDNTRRRHIPGLRAIDGVEIVGVCNRTAESTARAAAEHGIRRQFARWQDLATDSEIDAVVIGTWPNLHCEATCLALDAGKHVLCEARMASDLIEARQMAAAAAARPRQIAMLVPSPFGLECDKMMQELLGEYFLGDLREVLVFGADDQFVDYTKPLHWRQDRTLSGLNLLTVGILHETVSRWLPDPERLLAQFQTFEPKRPNPTAPGQVDVTVPDSCQALLQYPGGARGIYHFSGVAMLGLGKQVQLYGSRGAARIEFGAHDRVLVARAGDSEFRELVPNEAQRGGWRVEEEFVRAVRSEEPVRSTTFADGLRYMTFTAAVHRSAHERAWVDLGSM